MATNNSRGGGALLALTILAGTAIGLALGQSTIGILAGTGIGTVLATLLWLRDRKRDN